MPKKWRNHWAFVGDKIAAAARDRKLLTLGNLTIITQALNSTIRDADWQTKRAGKGDKGGLKKYAEGIDTVSKYLDFETWDDTTIQDRADYLSSQALQVWNIDTFGNA